jgi:hypothetical protein
MRIRVTLAALGLLALASAAQAWHRDGHFAVSRVAWKQLDQGQQLAIFKLLKAHPHYEIYLADQRPKDLVSEMDWAFLRASTWADWVRDPQASGLDAGQRQEIRKQYNKPVWHYVDLPFIHPSDVGKFDAAAIRRQILSPAFDERGEPRHALAALDLAVKQLRTPDPSPARQAVALCWLSHVVGDLHQPLHGTSLIASRETYDPPLDPPGGDLGGNRVVIRPSADSTRTVNLHFYWDALLFGEEPGIAGVDGVVSRLLNDPELQRDRLPELKAIGFLAWAEESLAVAQSSVYRGKDGFLKLQTLPAKTKTKQNGLEAPPLPEGYTETAQRVAARRMMLAGYRLADQLRQVYPTVRKN